MELEWIFMELEWIFMGWKDEGLHLWADLQTNILSHILSNVSYFLIWHELVASIALLTCWFCPSFLKNRADFRTHNYDTHLLSNEKSSESIMMPTPLFVVYICITQKQFDHILCIQQTVEPTLYPTLSPTQDPTLYVSICVKNLSHRLSQQQAHPSNPCLDSQHYIQLHQIRKLLWQF